MAQVISGTKFIFQVLFVDSAGQPVVVPDAKITIFTFTSSGSKTVLVDDADMSSVEDDVGRYVYGYTIPSALKNGMVYGFVTGTVEGVECLYEIEVAVVAPSTQPKGLYATFVKEN